MARQISDLLRESHGFQKFGSIVARAPKLYAETLLSRISALGEQFGEYEYELGRCPYRRLDGELGELPDEDDPPAAKQCAHFDNDLLEATRMALERLSVEIPTEFSALAANSSRQHMTSYNGS